MQVVKTNTHFGVSPSGKATDSDSVITGVRIPAPQPEKLHLACKMEFFSYIRLAASSMPFVRDIAFGSDMRFARWKLQGEYNITAERSGAISLLRKQKYHADEVSISLKLFTTHSFYGILYLR